MGREQLLQPSGCKVWLTVLPLHYCLLFLQSRYLAQPAEANILFWGCHSGRICYSVKHGRYSFSEYNRCAGC